jgi:hypothetical protein
MRQPLCVKCKDEKEPVMPHNGFWLLRGSKYVPIHEKCMPEKTESATESYITPSDS